VVEYVGGAEVLMTVMTLVDKLVLPVHREQGIVTTVVCSTVSVSSEEVEYVVINSDELDSGDTMLLVLSTIEVNELGDVCGHLLVVVYVIICVIVTGVTIVVDPLVIVDRETGQVVVVITIVFVVYGVSAEDDDNVSDVEVADVDHTNEL